MLSMPLDDVRRSGSVAVADGDGTFSSERGRKRTTKQRTISRRYREGLSSRGLSVLQSFTTLGNPGKKKIRMKKMALVVGRRSEL